MTTLEFRGEVRTAHGELGVGGVTVVAQIAAADLAGADDGGRGRALPLGRATTDADGRFTLITREDPIVSRAACVLEHCQDFTCQLVVLDGDGALLDAGPHQSYDPDAFASIVLPQPRAALADETWPELAERALRHQTVRLGDIATELASGGPGGTFAGWPVARRLTVLRQLEEALLDPTGALREARSGQGFGELEDEPHVAALRERFAAQGRDELVRALDGAVARARGFGRIADIAAFIDPAAFTRGDVTGGVTHAIDRDTLFDPIEFGWRRSPLRGYRDYLRDRWIESRPVPLGGALNPIVHRARLDARFHQDFATSDTLAVSALKVLVPIVVRILTAPAGEGYGFGVAAIPAQGTMSDREYLDALIALSGLDAAELGKRYRLRLDRDERALSSPVQQNIDTLQRFFTDSYQSVEDPFPVKPDALTGIPQPLIAPFPDQGAGAFVLEYEEWLARDAPFFPENHYDPRAMYGWTVHDRPSKYRDEVNANSAPLAQFLDDQKPSTSKFVDGHGGYDHRGAKWQWVRNHLDLHDLIAAAHADAKSLNYAAAESKYAIALAWADKLRDFVLAAPAGWWGYNPASIATAEKNTDVGTMAKLQTFELTHHLHFGYHFGIIPERDDVNRPFGDKPDITERFWNDNKQRLARVLDFLRFRMLPACLAESQLQLGKYADAVRQLIGPTAFDVFIGEPEMAFFYSTTGRLPFATSSDRTTRPAADPRSRVATNRAEAGYLRLKLGDALLEWADVLYRTDQPEQIMRARELYKGVIFLHGGDPEITPTWDRQQPIFPFFPFLTAARNPAIESQLARGQRGFFQIEHGLNFYGLDRTHVPPVRYRALKEAADRFAVGARGAQLDFLTYMQQLDGLTVSEMTARTMVAKANAAMAIAAEQQKIAEYQVAEVQKQVAAIQAQIAAKKAEIAASGEFFEQAKTFAKGMKDSVTKLGSVAFSGEGAAEAASAQNVSVTDAAKLAAKLGAGGADLGGATQALGQAGGTAGAFGAFLYAGVTSMYAMADEIAKRAGELKQLETVALPAAKALVELKTRDVTIAKLSQTIARADWQLGTDLLAFYATRFLNRSFLVSMTEFAARLLRRYLDLAGRTAWFAERALAFEQDRQLAIIGLDYYRQDRRGVSGADLLQLHLAELESARIQGLTQTIPVKHTISLARDFALAFGQIKRTGRCAFTTREAAFRAVYPGVYGYRVRNVTIGLTYADRMPPHRGLLTNNGVSVVTRNTPGSEHTLVRYFDALPLSQFRLRDDMWVFDLPDETLLPFEGSGVETEWELSLPSAGNPAGLDSLTDVLVTFDLRASYSAVLREQHLGQAAATVTRTRLISGKTANPGVIRDVQQNGGDLVLRFDLEQLARNDFEGARTITNLVLMASGLDAFTATLRSSAPARTRSVPFADGVALSNAGPLAGGNGGVPLPLNDFVGQTVDQTLTLTIDEAANPGVEWSKLVDVLLQVEYEATV